MWGFGNSCGHSAIDIFSPSALFWKFCFERNVILLGCRYANFRAFKFFFCKNLSNFSKSRLVLKLINMEFELEKQQFCSLEMWKEFKNLFCHFVKLTYILSLTHFRCRIGAANEVSLKTKCSIKIKWRNFLKGSHQKFCYINFFVNTTRR